MKCFPLKNKTQLQNMFLLNSNLIKKLTLLIVGIASIGISATVITQNVQNEMFQNEMFLNEIMALDGIPKAVIIDQIYKDYPNEEFLKKATEFLRKGGYKVDIITTDDVTVDFFKKLPSMNYEYVIFRGHSLADGNVNNINSATLFTGEKHDYHKYIKEQFQGHVSMGVPYLFSEIEQMGGFSNLQNETYFVIGSELIDELSIGTFPNSTIILAGCETTKKETLANSFLNKGASEVIGWSGLIDIKDNDMIVLQLLNETLVNDLEINEVVIAINEEFRGRLVYKTDLVYISADA